jgi:hypothetical protein
MHSRVLHLMTYDRSFDGLDRSVERRIIKIYDLIESRPGSSY